MTGPGPDVSPSAQIHVAARSYKVLETVYPFNRVSGRALYKVVQPELGLYYALKVISLEANANSADSIRSEVTALNRAARASPLIPKAHAVEFHSGSAHILLDWVEGKNLSDCFPRKPRGEKELRHRMNALVALAAVIHRVHCWRILHRDLKPANVILSCRNVSEGVRVVDFGIALSPRVFEEGTSGYHAPEQSGARFFNLTPAADIFALAQLGCFLASGSPLPLFPAINDWQELSVAPLFANFPRQSRTLSDVLARGLAFSPAQRFQSAKAFGESLKAANK